MIFGRRPPRFLPTQPPRSSFAFSANLLVLHDPPAGRRRLQARRRARAPLELPVWWAPGPRARPREAQRARRRVERRRRAPRRRSRATLKSSSDSRRAESPVKQGASNGSRRTVRPREENGASPTRARWTPSARSRAKLEEQARKDHSQDRRGPGDVQAQICRRENPDRTTNDGQRTRKSARWSNSRIERYRTRSQISQRRQTQGNAEAKWRTSLLPLHRKRRTTGT